MKRFVLTLVILLTAVSVSSGWIFRSYYSEVDLMERTKTDKSREVIRKYYPDSTLQFEGEYHRGRPDGLSKEYYPDGTTKAEVFFRNGRENDTARFYYPNGNLKAEIVYDKGKIEKTIRYDSTGTKISILPNRTKTE